MNQYSGPFWIQRRDTHQFVIAQGTNYDYTLRKDAATEFGLRETAKKSFDKLGLDATTHCIIPSADID